MGEGDGGREKKIEGEMLMRMKYVTPHSRDTHPDTCPKFFDRIVSIFFQYLFLGCDCLCYLVLDLDSQS